MILYNPTNGDVLTFGVSLRPRTCFLMTQLGTPIPPELQSIRRRVVAQLTKKNIDTVDADSIVTGKDFLEKIWRLIISVPLGVAIIHEDMTPKTLANIFYEIGLMDSLGKQTLVVKSRGAAIPSDFVRTEYIEANNKFSRRFQSFLETFLELESHFETMAEYLVNNPLLSIDYYRRAFLVSGDVRFRTSAREVLDEANLQERAANSVETLLARF